MQNEATGLNGKGEVLPVANGGYVRETALKLAIDAYRDSLTPEQLVNAAEIFGEFLTQGRIPAASV